MAKSEPAVRVTLTTIYQKLEDVEKVVGPLPEIIKDHETRMRAQEERKFVTPLGLWAVVTSTVGCIGIIAAIVARALDGK